MAMLGHAVAAHTFVAFTEEERDAFLAPCPAHAAHARYRDRRLGKQPGAQERQQRNEYARGVAAWTGDQSRLPDLVCPQLRQSIDRLLHKLRRRMLLIVKL